MIRPRSIRPSPSGLPPRAVDLQRWLPFKNLAGEEVPPFAVMKVTEWDGEDEWLKIEKPDEDNATCDIVVNGPTAIPANGFGSCTADFPARVKCQSAFSSGTCGVQAGSWELKSSKAGFLAQGGEDPASSSAMVTRCL